MRKVLSIIILILIGVWILGMFVTQNNYENKLLKYEEDLKEYHVNYDDFKKDSTNFRRNISAPKESIKWNKTKGLISTLNSSTDEPYLSAAQGIEVHLKGLTWGDYFLDNKEPIVREMEKKFGAEFKRTINSVSFDPDFKDNGYPDLLIRVENAPSFYEPNNVSNVLNNIFSKEPAPYKSFEIESCDSNKTMMDLWLVSVDLTFRIEPAKGHDRNKEKDFDGRHPITGKKASWSRGKREFKNKDNSYGNLGVLVEFKPKSNFYISEIQSNGLLSPINENPKIGIGAVECVSIKNISEAGANSPISSIGVNLSTGSSIALYPNIEELKEIYAKNSIDDAGNNELIEKKEQLNLEASILNHDNILEYCKNSVAEVDPNFFGSSKYSVLEIKNLGPWKNKEKFVFRKKEYRADLYTVNFLIHLYVLGEWTVKDQNLTKYKPRKPFKIERPTIWSYIIPDFLIGIIGKIFSGIIILLILLIILSIVVPSFGKLVGKIFKLN